jgi:hypothetical protein
MDALQDEAVPVVLPTILPMQYHQGVAPSLVGFTFGWPMMLKRIRIDFDRSVLERLSEA